jgi:hypothetical protein
VGHVVNVVQGPDRGWSPLQQLRLSCTDPLPSSRQSLRHCGVCCRSRWNQLPQIEADGRHGPVHCCGRNGSLCRARRVLEGPLAAAGGTRRDKSRRSVEQLPRPCQRICLVCQPGRRPPLALSRLPFPQAWRRRHSILGHPPPGASSKYPSNWLCVTKTLKNSQT